MAVRKLDPLVIGKSKNPRCFKNVNKLPVSYQSNKNAWMTAEIWREWMKRIDSRMCSKKRSIVMLCDNWAAHSNDTKLINVKLVFLPPNTTSLIQPIDMGIIANFKKLYRSLVLRRLVNNIDGGTESTSDKKAADMARKLTVLDSLHIQREAWSKITQLTTVNCYRKASFAMAEEKNEENEDEQADSDSNTEVYVPPGMSDEDFNCYMTVDNDLSTEADVDLSEIVGTTQSADQEHGNCSDDDEDNGDENDAGTTVSFAAVTESLSIVRCYMEQKGCSSYEPLYELQNFVTKLNEQQSKQTTINDFFGCTRIN